MTACNETKGSNDKGVSAKKMYSTCQGFEQNIVAGISQGIQDASVFAASSDCSSLASGKCVGHVFVLRIHIDSSENDTSIILKKLDFSS